MGITSVTEHFQGRRGSANVLGEMEYTRQFMVISDELDVSPDDIRNATGVPAMGAPYPSNTRAIVVNKDPQPYGDQRLFWMVEVKYSTTGHPTSGPLPTRPWNRRPRLRWGTYSVTEAVDKDRDGNVIQNGAGDRFDPAVTMEWHRPTLTITRYERRYDVNNALLYIDRVNELALTIAGLAIGAEGALLTRMDGANVEVDGAECWEVTYEIMFAPTFVKEVLNQGFYAYNYRGLAEEKSIIKLRGRDVTEPQLLTRTGLVLPAGAPEDWIPFHIYKKVDFGPLGLP